MASTVPVKSQPLHNFNLSRLKWNNSSGEGGDNDKEGSHSAPPHHRHQRRRSAKSPSRRPNSSRSPLRNSPLRDASTALCRDCSPLREAEDRSRLKNLMVDGAKEGACKESEVSGVTRSRHSTVDGTNSGTHVDQVKNPPIKAMSWGAIGADVVGAKRLRTLTIDGGKDPIHKKSEMNLEVAGKLQGTSVGGLSEARRSKNFMTDGAKSGIRSSDMKLKATVEADVEVIRRPRSSSADSAKNGGFMLDSEGKSKVSMDADIAEVKNSKLLIKLPFKNGGTAEKDDKKQVKAKQNDEEDDRFSNKDDDNGNNNNSHNDLDEETKTWNLRPRKPIHKSLNVHGIKSVVAKNDVSDHNHSTSNNKVARSPLRNPTHKSVENEGNCVDGGEKKVKRKLSINVFLTKDEIEEDIFAMTGSKPARRPKKRAKNVQRQLDYAFPGLWLVGINTDSYKVSEPLIKG